jgi:hypothetical protein
MSRERANCQASHKEKFITMDRQTKQPSVALDGLGSMIEDRQRYEEASALCLLSIARSQERIADALEMIVGVMTTTEADERDAARFDAQSHIRNFR